ncbi:beta-lactamase/transpeptidase-like protein [Periconia macrospinosa]|uniref:Beta-lactamase/transpeptidase-like protein n=1 Tax=Periconia macrospinosa TaxID=97972 RepID=A0A2V1CZK0_9PLEO|nr:beta-lactamase/transpeptidase-like protein [Periconia macrospinosa]
MLLSAASAASSPLSGALFSPPTQRNSSVLNADLNNLTTILNNGLSTGNSSHGAVDTSSAYAVQIFSLSSPDPLFSYYHDSTVLSPSGAQNIDGESVFRIGSVSKLVSIYMLLREIGDGHWDTPITDILPELRDTTKGRDRMDFVAWDDITLGALAGQLAGIPRELLTITAYDLLSKPEDILKYGFPPLSSLEVPKCTLGLENGPSCDRAAFFAALDTRPPVVLPNTKPIYSNVAFILIGYALETLTGKSYKELLSGLTSSLSLAGTSVAPPNNTRIVIPFNVSSSNWALDLDNLNPSGGIYSSANDLAALGRAILNSTLLPPRPTRGWLKLIAFNAELTSAVGRPWEICRADTVPSRGAIDIYAKGQGATSDTNRASYDPSLNLNFTFGSSSTPRPGSVGSSSAYHKHRHTSSLSSDFTKLVHSTNGKIRSDGSFHTAEPDPAEHRVSWGEPSTKRHHSRRHRASASSAILPSRRASSNIVVVDRTQYQIMKRPRTPLHFPFSPAPSLPGRTVPPFSTDEMADMVEPQGFDLAPSPKRRRSLSESDKGSGRSSNRVV